MTASSSTTTNSSSSVSTADTSSSNPPPPPPQHALHHHITSSASSGGGGGAPLAPRAPPRVGVGGGGVGQSQACAACKYQRRKCNADCPLARYFPADEQRRFLNAHHLFGVSKIQKTLRDTPPELHADAMQALTFEANARASDPVGGAARVVVELGRQYELLHAELVAVQHHLKLCRQQHAAAAAAAAEAANDPLVGNDPLADPAAEMLFAGAGAVVSNPNDDAMVDAFYADQQTAAGDGDGGGGLQEQFLVKDETQAVQPPPPQQPYEYLYYGTVGDEGSSHAWCSGNGGEADASPPMGLSDQLQQCQIGAAATFVEAFDVKPDLPATMEHSGSVLLEQPERKLLAAAGSSSSSAAAAAAHCQLELGCSSNAWKVGAHVN
uniref:LOB domain-containing protein n=1 Tax=Oryza punctata TaxID=4537 RepID=A0A0E0M0E6_ORYPU